MTNDQTHQFAPLTASAKPPGTLNAAARAIWRKTLEDSPAGWLALSDAPALAAYAALLARLEVVAREVNALSSEIVDTSHGPQVHPSVRLLDMLARRASQARYELRLNPNARAKSVTLTKLGRDRAAREAGARAQADEDHADRTALLFGGARRAAAVES
jgi:phage terminase small subunit